MVAVSLAMCKPGRTVEGIGNSVLHSDTAQHGRVQSGMLFNYRRLYAESTSNKRLQIHGLLP